jgi:hypothetical protein
MTRGDRKYTPGGCGIGLEARLPLDGDGDFYPAGAWSGPIEIHVPPPPADAAPPDPPVPGPPAVVPLAPDDDPFEHSFAPVEDHVPDGPNPPHSACPGFPPD